MNNMPTAQSATRQKYPLSQRKIIKKTITGIISWSFVIGFLLFMLIGVIAGVMSESNVSNAAIFNVIIIGVYISFCVLTALGVLTYFYQKWYFDVYFYEISDDYLVIKKGPIAPREITIPWERIQDVYVDQDPLDRMFGLFDVHLSTATITSGLTAHIDGVEQQAADGLRSELLAHVKSRISRK